MKSIFKPNIRIEYNFRRSIALSKQNSNTDKETLLQGASIKKTSFSRESASAASNIVTNTMQQNLRQINERIERNTLIGISLESSTQVLRKSHESYLDFRNVIGKSREILSKLNQRDRTDKLLLFFSFLVFLLVILYIVKQRLWFPGISFFFTM